MSCQTSIKGKVELQCVYLGYACGECEAKYKIKKIINHEYALPEGINESDLKVVFTSSNQVRDIDNIVKGCAICYDYYFWGSLVKRSGNDYFTMNIDSVNVMLRDDSCCDKSK